MALSGGGRVVSPTPLLFQCKWQRHRWERAIRDESHWREQRVKCLQGATPSPPSLRIIVDGANLSGESSAVPTDSGMRPLPMHWSDESHRLPGIVVNDSSSQLNLLGGLSSSIPGNLIGLPPQLCTYSDVIRFLKYSIPYCRPWPCIYSYIFFSPTDVLATGTFIIVHPDQQQQAFEAKSFPKATRKLVDYFQYCAVLLAPLLFGAEI